MMATVAAAAANLVGDTLLCVFPFKLGIAGAAWATVAAQAVRRAGKGLAPQRQACGQAVDRVLKTQRGSWGRLI